MPRGWQNGCQHRRRHKVRQHPPCKERLQGHARRPHKPTHACDEKSPDLLHVCGRHSLHTNRQNPPGSKWYSDGIFIVLKENLGRSPGPKAVIDERYMSSKRCMFQQKDDHRESRKQNSASITLHQHTTSYTATEHREVIGLWLLCPLE